MDKFFIWLCVGDVIPLVVMKQLEVFIKYTKDRWFEYSGPFGYEFKIMSIRFEVNRPLSYVGIVDRHRSGFLEELPTLYFEICVNDKSYRFYNPMGRFVMQQQVIDKLHLYTKGFGIEGYCIISEMYSYDRVKSF